MGGWATGGRILETNGVLHLIPWEARWPDEFVWVAWAGLDYFVYTNQIVNFCNQVNAGYGPEWDMRGALTRLPANRAGEFKVMAPPWPAPRVPEEYQKYLPTTPIEGTITKVTAPRYHEHLSSRRYGAEVMIDKGSDDGLHAGMQVRVVLENYSCYADLKRVTEKTSVISLTDLRESEVLGLAGKKVSVADKKYSWVRPSGWKWIGDRSNSQLLRYYWVESR